MGRRISVLHNLIEPYGPESSPAHQNEFAHTYKAIKDNKNNLFSAPICYICLQEILYMFVSFNFARAECLNSFILC